MIRWLRIVFRMQRFEFLAVAVFTAGWAIGAAFLVWQMSQITSANPECFGHIPSGPHCPAIQDVFAPWEQAAQALLAIGFLGPFLVGLVLGIPIVAREIEQGTAQIAWSLSLSRARWFAWRAVPVVLGTVLALSVYATGGELLARGRLGLDDPGFLSFADRGPLVVLRGIMLLSIAALVGAWIGRILPALLTAAALAAMLTFGLGAGLDAWRATEATVVESESAVRMDPDLLGGLYLGQVAILPDGTVTTDRHVDRLPADFKEGFLFLRASTYWTWMSRESAITALLAVLAVTATVLLLRVRRPL